MRAAYADKNYSLSLNLILYLRLHPLRVINSHNWYIYVLLKDVGTMLYDLYLQ